MAFPSVSCDCRIRAQDQLDDLLIRRLTAKQRYWCREGTLVLRLIESMKCNVTRGRPQETFADDIWPAELYDN